MKELFETFTDLIQIGLRLESSPEKLDHQGAFDLLPVMGNGKLCDSSSFLFLCLVTDGHSYILKGKCFDPSIAY